MNDSCSITMLEAALAGSLPTDDEASLQQHLDHCEQCTAELERLAGGAGWRQEVASLLQTDELDEELPTSDDWSAIDFTVDHLEPADEPNVLGRLGGYDVLEIIGRGGMGVVLKAFDRDLKRCVAIKVLAPHLAQSALARKRFAREAQAAAAVVHPHVLAIHHVQPAGRLPFLVMPLVAGESLAQRLAAQGALELKEVLRIGMQAAAGLAAAHEQGLVHRDVKPANILLEKGVERAVLTDFGLARAADDVALTRGGAIAGTPQYMSPEQARGDALDGRSDLFSLGCVLYEMATGVSPFRADSVMATLRRLVDDAPQPLASLNPELPAWFIGIVNRLLEKDPAQRFSSAQEVSDLLNGCLAHIQQPATSPLPEIVARPAVRRLYWHKSSRFAKVIATIAVSGIVLLGALMLAADPPDIAGRWLGEEWGDVSLEKRGEGEYAGTFALAVGKQAGEIQLKWSRIERRFNGTWREGEDRFGELSVRLVGNEILGAFSTDRNSRINPATPRLADLKWTKAVFMTSTVAPASESPNTGGNSANRAALAGFPRAKQKPPEAEADHSTADSNASQVRLFRLRFKLASDMVDELRQILLGRPGQVAKPSADNQEILVNAPPGVLDRVQTYIAVTDWPDVIWRKPNCEYPRETVARAARSFFYACAIEDSPEYFSNLLSVDVLAELKGDTRSQEYLDYEMGGAPNPEWEKSLRGDWPGKKEAIERMVREWNRHSLRTLREESGIAIGFGTKHFCSVSFKDADKSFYSVIVRPDPNKGPDGQEAYLFGSLPPWWQPAADKKRKPDAKVGVLRDQGATNLSATAPADAGDLYFFGSE